MSMTPIRQKLDMVLPDDVRRIAGLFHQAGHSLFVVGGAVRDTLLGKVPKDFDLTTDALPDRVIEILSSIGDFRLLEVGKSFGVIVVHTKSNQEFEIATFRRDDTPGRRPDSVTFTSIDEDVRRRDLTINALFFDTDSCEVVDFVGGLEDLANSTVRAVGIAADRFREDRLRILRTIRFAARFGSEIESETAAAIANDNSLDGVSRERIRDEFLKGLASAKSVVGFLETITDFDLWGEIFPDAEISRDFHEVSDVPVQLALLLRNVSHIKIPSTLLDLKFTSGEICQVKFLLQFSNLETIDGAVILKKAFKNSRLSLKQLKAFSVFSGWPMKTWANNFVEFVQLQHGVTPTDLMQRGLKGKEIGDTMDQAEAELFESLF